jgi:hypothetical protein
MTTYIVILMFIALVKHHFETTLFIVVINPITMVMAIPPQEL